MKLEKVFAFALCALGVVSLVSFAQAGNVATVKTSAGAVKGNYDTVQAAVTAAATGETVIMAADSIENVTVSGKTITLDLNGKTLTGYKVSGPRTDDKPTVKVESGAGLTIDDTSADGLGKVTSYQPTSIYDVCSANGAGIYSAGNLTLLGGSVTGCVGGHLLTSDSTYSRYMWYRAQWKAVNGAGVYVAGGSITVGGTAKVYDNIIRTCYDATNELYETTHYGVVKLAQKGVFRQPENIYLTKGTCIEISKDKPLQPGARFGVTTVEMPAKETTVAFTSNGSENDVQYFESNIKKRSVRYANGHLELVEDEIPVDETMFAASNDWGTKYNPFAEPTTLPHWLSNLCWHREWTNSLGQTEQYSANGLHGDCSVRQKQDQANWFLGTNTYFTTTNLWLSAGVRDPNNATNAARQSFWAAEVAKKDGGTQAHTGSRQPYYETTLLSQFLKKANEEYPKGTEFSNDKAGALLSRAICTLLRKHEEPASSSYSYLKNETPYIKTQSALLGSVAYQAGQYYEPVWQSSFQAGQRLDGDAFHNPHPSLLFASYMKNSMSNILQVVDDGGTLVRAVSTSKKKETSTAKAIDVGDVTESASFTSGYGTALTNAIACLDEFPSDWQGDHLLAGKDNAEAIAAKMDWPMFDEDVYVDRGDVLLMKFACHALRLPIKFLRAYRLTGDVALFDENGKYIAAAADRTELRQLQNVTTNMNLMYPRHDKTCKERREYVDMTGRFKDKTPEEMYKEIHNLSPDGLAERTLGSMDMQGRIEYAIYSFFNEMPTMFSKITRPEQLAEARESLKEALRCYLDADAFIFGRESKTGDKIVGQRDVNKLHLFELVEEEGAEWNAAAWRYLAEQLWESVNGEKASEIDLVKLGAGLNIRSADHALDFSGLGPNRDGKLQINANAAVTGAFTRDLVKDSVAAIGLVTYDQVSLWWPRMTNSTVYVWNRSGWWYNRKIKLTLNEDTVDTTLGGIYPAGSVLNDLATMTARYPGDGTSHYAGGTASHLSGFAERLDIATVTATAPSVANATAELCLYGVPSGTNNLVVPYKAPVTVVYTANDGYLFTDGSAVATNTFDTSVNPATVVGTLPVASPCAARAFDEEGTLVGRYLTLDAAITAVPVKGTVKLIKDQTGDYTIKETKEFTLAPNGFACGTLTAASGYVVTQGITGLWYHRLGYQVTFSAGTGAPSPTTLPANFLYCDRGTAWPLAKPTYTSSTTAFAGWSFGSQSLVTNEIPAGLSQALALTATWKAAQKITVKEEPTSAKPQVDITVSQEWIDKNVKPSATTEEIQTTLNKADPNGNMKWQNYVIGLESNATVTADSKQTDDPSIVPVVPANVNAPLEDTGFNVSYSLDQVTTNGTVVGTPGAPTTKDGLAVKLDEVKSNAYFKVNIIVTKNGQDPATAGTKIAATNTLGVLSVADDRSLSIIGVPWGKLGVGDADIAVADLIKTANLTPGDKIHVYRTNTKQYETWVLSEEGTWVPVQTVKAVKSAGPKLAFAANPTVATAKRGDALWLDRQDVTTPVYLYGQVATNESVTTELTAGAEKWNLVASPRPEPLDLNKTFGAAHEGDQIIVPTGGVPKNYTYKGGKWGYPSTEPVMKGGVQVGVRAVRKTDDTIIPAGTGFWYVNQGGTKKEIRW